ncbi:putative F-box/FBD/LRR-repeat protein At5g44950 isoform X2 [Panicum virgatum]|uniref:putative F-box/FBD/LRR-repeat protein At5g44950 isoform X2 n=1 Tax=Panicum virgatum TaxID=38727 RepID=UPI0019D59968|nr:putative F-box/FBD/LRR-repeat protein At5g44950 isoform X2 [Panicum virgatum]
MPLMKQALPGIRMRSSNCQKSGPDRISALPDELLLHVMYFLTLQEAVQTSLLSRRWKNLWASLMWLNFDAAKFSSIRTYRKFVNNALQYRSSLPMLVPLDAFWISTVCDNSDDSLDYSDIQPWIHHALNSKAWALGILKHSGPKPLSMESYPFPFTSVYLKILGLSHCFIDDWFVQNLSSCCPVLDDLDLMSCAIHVTMFSSTTLKSLAITITQTDKDFPIEFQYLVIDMPNLVSLSLEEIPRRIIHLMDVSSVKTASIFLFSLSFGHSQVQCSILSALSNATSLTLVSPSVYEDVVPKVLGRDLPRCATFSKLKRQHLGEWFLSGGCYPLIYLLRRSPNIEKLILQLDTQQRLAVESLEKSGSTATCRGIKKEPRSSYSPCQPILALSLALKSNPFQFRMGSGFGDWVV